MLGGRSVLDFKFSHILENSGLLISMGVPFQEPPVDNEMFEPLCLKLPYEGKLEVASCCPFWVFRKLSGPDCSCTLIRFRESKWIFQGGWVGGCQYLLIINLPMLNLWIIQGHSTGIWMRGLGVRVHI